MHWNSAVAFARKVNVTIFILIKTGYSSAGVNMKVANIDTYRDRQGQTRTDRGRQRQAGTSMHRQG